MSNAHTCLTCSRTFVSAGALASHTRFKVKGHAVPHTANPSAPAIPPVTIIVATTAGLRLHVMPLSNPNTLPKINSTRRPANDANPSPPVNPPVTALATDSTPHLRHICTTCSNPKKFATAAALRSHTAAKHRGTSMPGPVRKAKKRTNAPRYGYNYNHSYRTSEFDGLVGVDSDGDFECIGGCSHDGLVMCKNC